MTIYKNNELLQCEKTNLPFLDSLTLAEVFPHAVGILFPTRLWSNTPVLVGDSIHQRTSLVPENQDIPPFHRSTVPLLLLTPFDTN